MNNIFEELATPRQRPEISEATIALAKAVEETDRQHDGPHLPFLRSVERGEVHGIPMERWLCSCGWQGAWFKRGWLR